MINTTDGTTLEQCSGSGVQSTLPQHSSSRPLGKLQDDRDSNDMDETESEYINVPAEHNDIAGRTRLRRTSTLKKTMLAMLFICASAPRAAGQRHQRLWPPPNIEPCVIQCAARHVQMTGNRSSGPDMSYWGPQPILEFMSNSQWQTSALPLRPTTLAVDVAAASGSTTLRTSVTAVASPTRSRAMSFACSATFMAISGAEEALVSSLVVRVVLAVLGCIAVVY